MLTNPSVLSHLHQSGWHRAGQEVERDHGQLWIGFEGKSKRNSDVAAMTQDFGQPARWLRRRSPVLAISEVAKICGDLGSRPVRAAARHLIDCLSLIHASPAQQYGSGGAVGQPLTRCEPTVFTSQPVQKLSVASCESSKLSIRSAMLRRSWAIAA